jgi:hypothetical protein
MPQGPDRLRKACAGARRIAIKAENSNGFGAFRLDTPGGRR